MVVLSSWISALRRFPQIALGNVSVVGWLGIALDLFTASVAVAMSHQFEYALSGRSLIVVVEDLKMRFVFLVGFVVWLSRIALLSAQANADSVWEPMHQESNASLRGLFVLDANVVWASGTNGTVVHTSDQGQTWKVQRLAGAESLDIRDLHVFDEQNILAMTSGTPARLYRSADTGASWRLVYESTDPQVFLDSVSFLNDAKGLVMGDPINGQLFLLHTNDAGWTWEQVPATPKLESGEAGFAASGTNMTTLGGDHWVIGLGGDLPAEQTKEANSEGGLDQNHNDRPLRYSRVVIVDSQLKDWRIIKTPVRRHESGGIFSIVFVDSKVGVAVGGDYKQPDVSHDHISVTNNGGETWTVPNSQQSPSGFRSCVAIWKPKNSQPQLIAVGTNGTDVSTDLGRTWRRVSDLGFNTVQFSPDGRIGWAAGSNGRVAKWRKTGE